MNIYIAVVLTVGTIIVVVSVFLVVLNFIHRGIDADKREASILNEFVNYYGKQSLSSKQIKGNGFLLLYSDEIIFVRLFPYKKINIMLKSILRADVAYHHLEKLSTKKLLRLSYRYGEQIEIVAFAVENAGKWIEMLNCKIR